MVSAVPEKLASIEQLRSDLARRFPSAGIAQFPESPVEQVALSAGDSSASALVTTLPNRVLSPQGSTAQGRFSQISVHEQAAQIPGGAVTEVVGSPGSGGCTLLLEHLARLLGTESPKTRESGAAIATPTVGPAAQRYAAYVDMTGTFYPPAAAALGVPLDRLIIVKPADLPLALRVVEVLLRGGAARTVILDLPAQSRPLRLSTYHRLRRHVRHSGASLVFLSPVSLMPADHRIDLERESAVPIQVNAYR